MTTKGIQHLCYTVVGHDPHSTVFMQSDYYLLPKLKESLRGIHLNLDDAVQTEVRL